MAESKDDAVIRLKKAKDFKAQGTKFFSEGEYVKAIYCYRKILEVFDNLKGKEMTGQNETERKDLVQAGQLNIAQCWMKLKVWYFRVSWLYIQNYSCLICKSTRDLLKIV